MDRIIQYPSAIPLADDILRTNKYTMTALGMTLKAILGTSTIIDGLACTPTGPASMQVIVTPGSIYSLENIDGTAYGDLDADTTHQIVKQGISLDNTLLSCPAPATTGQSINYLIQVDYQDQDTDSVVLPYFNASNPAVAFAGPANSGVSQNTTRKGACVISVKAGAAATTGTQTTPAPDAGFTGLWYVTVANGATSITSGNIHLYSGAASATGSTAFWSTPFITEKLNDKVSLATGDLRWAPISGGGGSARTVLTGNTTFYVATTGNDSNPGTSGSPWLTLQHAYDYIVNNIDLAGFACNVSVGAGTYAGGLLAQYACTGGIPTFTGDTTTPSNCLISTTNAAVAVQNTAALNIAGFKTTTSTGHGLVAERGGNINITGKMDFGAVGGGLISQIACFTGGKITCGVDYIISGGGEFHIYCAYSASINIQNSTITLTGTPNFTQSWCRSTDVASVNVIVGTFSGSATGSRYSANLNGIINTQGHPTTYFPGSSVGTTDGTGQYA